MSDQNMTDDPRIAAVPDIHGHAKGEHKLYVDERPIPYTARMLFLWFFHACRRGAPRFLMVADHINYLTFEDPAAVNLVRRALKLAQAGDLYGAAETAGVEVNHAAVVGEGLRRGMRYSIGAEVDNDPRSRPDAQNIVDAMRPDGMVRSVHFLPIKHPQFGENWMWPFDNPEFRELYDVVGTGPTWELYMATLLDAIDKLPGHVVGHFYVPAKFGHWPADELLEGYEDRLLEACATRGMAVEVNSRYFYKHAAGDEENIEKYRTANLRLLRKAKDKGVMVAVGSDAHSPKDQGRGFGEVLALLDRAEINEIAFPIDGRLARVALRATEELRRASALAAREARPEAVAIPGTEDLDALEDEAPDTDPQEAAEAAAPEARTTAAKAPAPPRKRPSRAKKVAAEGASPPETAAPEARVRTGDESSNLFAAPVRAPEPTGAVHSLDEAAPATETTEPEERPRSGDAAARELREHAVRGPADPASEQDEAPANITANGAGAIPADPAYDQDREAPETPRSPARRASKRPLKAASAKRTVRTKAGASAKATGATKKSAAKRPAAKKASRPSRSPAAKKFAAKKAPAARKAAAKTAPKTVSRSSAKKPTAKKPAAKKKAAKSRR